jgi:lipid-binding SYLF domain-containing protein
LELQDRDPAKQQRRKSSRRIRSREAVSMKKVILLVVVFGLTSLSFAGNRKDSVQRLSNAATVLNEIMATPDKGIPLEVFENAKCIAVVPNMVKAAFVFGGKHGRGVATCRTANGGWSAPAFISVGGGSWGLQIGAQSIDLVMTVMNDKGMQHMLSNKFQVGGDAAAVAGPVGRHASAGTDWKADSEILTYSRAKGLFAGISLTGAVVQQDDDSTKTMYRKMISQKEILGGSVKAPAAAASFVNAVHKSGAKARIAEAKDNQ